MTPRRRYGWPLAALAVGAATWGLTATFGTGPLRVQASPLGCLAALFVFGLRFVRLRPPGRRARAREAALGRGARNALLAALAAWCLFGVANTARQAVTGYRDLGPDAVLGARAPLKPGFYAAEGTPALESLYAMSGSEGDRFLVPLEPFEGRLLVVTATRPEARPVRATGRLRGDLKTVLATPGGDPAGPFLPGYRAHVGLPPEAPVYFLDTSVRAGVNLSALVHVLAPLYLLLLVLGAPVRPPAPPS